MDTLLGVVGGLVIGAVIWEVFRDLFHPGDSGALTEWLGRHLFDLLRRRPPLLPLAGPLTVVAVILLWVLALVAGFALVYYGSFPEGFRTSTGPPPPSEPRLLQVLYFSFATLITLGYGDIVPDATPLRMLSAVEGLIGFGLLTASVSSIVLLYPALSRMRLLARGVSTLVKAEESAGVSVAGSGSHDVLFDLARQVSNARIDLVHFPVTYYFATSEASASIAHWSAHLARMAEEGRAVHGAQMRLAAGALDCALDDLAELLAERFLHMKADDRRAVFRALARDHAMEIA